MKSSFLNDSTKNIIPSNNNALGKAESIIMTENKFNRDSAQSNRLNSNIISDLYNYSNNSNVLSMGFNSNKPDLTSNQKNSMLPSKIEHGNLYASTDFKEEIGELEIDLEKAYNIEARIRECRNIKDAAVRQEQILIDREKDSQNRLSKLHSEQGNIYDITRERDTLRMKNEKLSRENRISLNRIDN